MCCALEFAAANTDPELVRRAKTLAGWVRRSDNWALSDSLSSLYSRIFEVSPKTMAPWLEKWSRSKNPWERRQSLVSLLYYSSARGSHSHAPLETILRYVERAIDDDHYFVQKGVGWAIREAYNVHPTRMLAWIRRNAARIAPAAWYATTEKLDAETKAELKTLRGSRRARGSGGSRGPSIEEAPRRPPRGRRR
jgi:3-methyladenine DNA glycosylase AlkD